MNGKKQNIAGSVLLNCMWGGSFSLGVRRRKPHNQEIQSHCTLRLSNPRIWEPYKGRKVAATDD